MALRKKLSTSLVLVSFLVLATLFTYANKSSLLSIENSFTDIDEVVFESCDDPNDDDRYIPFQDVKSSLRSFFFFEKFEPLKSLNLFVQDSYLLYTLLDIPPPTLLKI